MRDMVYSAFDDQRAHQIVPTAVTALEDPPSHKRSLLLRCIHRIGIPMFTTAWRHLDHILGCCEQRVRRVVPLPSDDNPLVVNKGSCCLSTNTDGLLSATTDARPSREIEATHDFPQRSIHGTYECQHITVGSSVFHPSNGKVCRDAISTRTKMGSCSQELPASTDMRLGEAISNVGKAGEETKNVTPVSIAVDGATLLDTELNLERLNITSYPSESVSGACSEQQHAKADNAIKSDSSRAQNFAALREIFRRCALQEGAAFSRKSFGDALLSSSSVLFTSRPVAVAATKPIFRMCAIILAVYFGFQCYTFMAQSANNGEWLPKPHAVRFLVLGLRKSDANLSFSNSFEFGLLVDGCPCGLVVNSSGASASIALDAQTPVNGYYFRIFAGLPINDPVRWVVQISGQSNSSQSSNWFTVGASAWTRLRGSLLLLPDIEFAVPTDRGTLVKMDMRPRWQETVNDDAVHIAITLGWAAFSLAWLTRDLNSGVWAFSGQFAVIALLETVAAIGFLLVGDWRPTLEVALNAIPDGLFAAVVAWDERHIVLALVGYGTLKLFVVVINGTIIFPAVSDLVFAIILNGGFFSIIFPLAALVFRRRALLSAHRLVLVDKARYDKAWNEILKNPAEQHAVRALSVLVSTLISATNVAKNARQFNRAEIFRGESTLNATARHGQRSLRQLSELKIEHTSNIMMRQRNVNQLGSVFTCGIPGSLDPNHSVRSLDQLYCQAIALNPLIIKKVWCWSSASCGCFSVNWYGSDSAEAATSSEALPKGFLRWEDAERMEAQFQGNIRWARVKSVQRSIEKATRSYGKDVSRLVDLCRQSIYFESIANIITCLAAICGDKDVALARVRNRLDPSFDSSQSAGYRNLAINLRLVSSEATRLGVEGHVCEIQLLLASMAVIKDDEGHRKYTAYRNLRGE